MAGLSTLMSSLIKFVSRPASLRRLVNASGINSSVRQFGWLTKVAVRPDSIATVPSTPIVSVRPTSVRVVAPLFTLESNTDPIINLFKSQRLLEVCKQIWKKDLHARRLYTLFYLKYHLHDNDPGLHSIAKNVDIYGNAKDNLSYYLNHLLDKYNDTCYDSYYITIDEKRQIINATFHDYDQIQPLIRISK